MSGDESFHAAHAEAEIERLGRAATSVDWKAPNGEIFSMTVPPTVYPPREDTDLLASVLTSHRLPPKTRWLEIGCGSGVLSLYAARLGCRVTACDVNPFAVACTRAHFREHGLDATVHEGGPGPVDDGKSAQWGGDQTYDVVVWNTPYLDGEALRGAKLGPFEEAALTDNDQTGLYARMLYRMASSNLLSRHGVAYLTVSSKGVGDTACELAWSAGLAARCVASRSFEDGERLSVIALWKPYVGAPVVHLPHTESTNDDVAALTGAVGASVRADKQTTGRGRRGRTWQSYPGAFMASWLVHSGEGWSHATADQLRVGEAMVRLVRYMSGTSPSDVCLKWPNDVFVRSLDGHMKKAGGVLFEAISQGDAHHILLGIGLNLKASSSDHGSVHDLGHLVSAADLHPPLHAMVASLFERLPLLPRSGHFDGIEQAVLQGEEMLGPLFYRGHQSTLLGINAEGALRLEGIEEAIEEPEDLMWSGV